MGRYAPLIVAAFCFLLGAGGLWILQPSRHGGSNTILVLPVALQQVAEPPAPSPAIVYVELPVFIPIPAPEHTITVAVEPPVVEPRVQAPASPATPAPAQPTPRAVVVALVSSDESGATAASANETPAPLRLPGVARDDQEQPSTGPEAGGEEHPKDEPAAPTADESESPEPAGADASVPES